MEQKLLAKLEAERTFLWGLSYRMTGSAADAEDVVQDTFERALRSPPSDTERELRPWLTRVAVNRARDLLRARRRRGYKGPYLPAPIQTSDELPDPASVASSELHGEARYGQLESVTFAFLLALEALTPAQRAVLLLRDVFEYSVLETAALLEQREGTIKTTHHRARRALEHYDSARCVPSPELLTKTQQALMAFVTCLANNDVTGLRALLADDVCAVNDANGEFLAAGRVVEGRDKVILFHQNVLLKKPREPAAFGVRFYNGLPALLVRYKESQPREAPTALVRVEIDARGLITRVYTVLATGKLSATDFSTL